MATINSNILIPYKGSTQIDTGAFYAPYVPLTVSQPRNGYPSPPFKTAENLGNEMYQDLMMDHVRHGEPWKYTVIIPAADWEELMDWCISHFDNFTWCWNHKGEQDAEWEIGLRNEDDAVLISLTWS
jgi:Major capsid protein Gp23